MGTSDEAERMAREDPQPGTSTFDRNHPGTYLPMPFVPRLHEMAKSLRERSEAIEAGDRTTARMMVNAAHLMERAAFEIGVPFRRTRHAMDAQTNQETDHAAE